MVLSSTSPNAFCAGADINEPLSAADGVSRMEAFTALYVAVETFPAPTICVCAGHCVGAGAEIAAGCDLRVVADNAKLAWSGALLGVPVGPARLSPLVGHARAKELIFTGRPIECAEADALGLAARTAKAEEAEATAIALAGELAASPTGGAAAPEAHVLRLRRHARPGCEGERRPEPLAAARPGPAVRDAVRRLTSPLSLTQ